MKYFSVCSGIEAASVAWHPLGWQPVGFSEIEPFPSAVLQHHFPNTKNYGDLTKYPEWGIEPGAVDLLVGGTPCQSFSVAGLRKGMSDPRGNLALTFLGLADKLKPRWIVWENVPGVLSSNGGRDFGAFLGALGELGYGFAYRVLDAQHFGVPQRRRRVFVVASLGGWQLAAKVLFESDCLRGNPKKGRAKGEGTATSVEDGIGKSTWWDGGQVSQTIDAVVAKQQTMPEKNPFPAVLQPFRKPKRAQSNKDDESWVEAKESNTLNNFDLGDTRTTHAVVQPICFEPRSQDGHARIVGNISPTLNTASGGQRQPCIAFQPGNLRRKGGADPSETVFPTLTKDSGDQSPHIAHPIAIQGTIIGRSENAGPQGVGASEGPMFTLTKTDIHGVSNPPMAVRRLTPMECERLQGFPDNWTQIPWKGKTVDDCPDGPRYKACGNSMAVPVMRWIGERIAQFDK